VCVLFFNFVCVDFDRRMVWSVREGSREGVYGAGGAFEHGG
jgi:hypothetical protein